jgi:hypothetical protein
LWRSLQHDRLSQSNEEGMLPEAVLSVYYRTAPAVNTLTLAFPGSNDNGWVGDQGMSEG